MRKQRSSNIELLRIIAMFLIILHHTIVHGVLDKQTFDFFALSYFSKPKLQEQISHTINPIKSVFSLIFIFYGLNLTGGSSGEKLFGCLIASLPAR